MLAKRRCSSFGHKNVAGFHERYRNGRIGGRMIYAGFIHVQRGQCDSDCGSGCSCVKADDMLIST